MPSGDSAIPMESASCEWVVHKLNLHLTSRICLFGKVERVTIFFLEETSGLLAALWSPSRWAGFPTLHPGLTKAVALRVSWWSQGIYATMLFCDHLRMKSCGSTADPIMGHHSVVSL